MSRGKLKPEDEKCIQKNYLYLKNNLDALDIVDYLYQHEVITFEDKEEIHKSGSTRTKRNEILLATLLNAGPGEAFNYFLKSLEDKHKHILEGIKQTEKEKKDNESLQEENKNLNDELIKQKKVNESLQEENTFLKSELAKTKEININLQEEITCIADTAVKQKKVNESLQEENTFLKSELAKTKEININLQDEINCIADTAGEEMCQRWEVKLLKKINMLDDELECYKSENQNLTEKLVERDNEIKSWKTNCDISIQSLKNQVISEQETTGILVDSELNDDYLEELTLEYISLNGKHEIDIVLINEENYISKCFADCKKNPGHADFIPFETFNINNLPQHFRKKSFYKHTQALAELTVKIDVTMTSLDRPEFLPGTTIPFPCSDIRGSTIQRSGSGFVYNIVRHIGICGCIKCKQSDKLNSVYWKIYIITSQQVVFDSSEAMRSSARLFYDKHDSPLVVLTECSCNFFNDTNDTNQHFIIFDSCDADICCKLTKQQNKLEKYANLLGNEPFQNSKLAFIVSHPHGGPKYITIGKEYDKNKVFRDDVFYKCIYSVSTCSGSSGAPVYFYDYKRMYAIHSGAFNFYRNALGYSESIQCPVRVLEQHNVLLESEKTPCNLM